MLNILKNSSIDKLQKTDYKAVFDAISENTLISMTDAHGDILYANEKFLEVTKYSLSELIGKNHRVLKSNYHTLEFYQDLWTTITSGNIWRGEIKNKAKDGTFHWVDTTIVPISSSDNKPERYISVRFLITEKKDFEKKLKDNNQKLENTNSAILNVLEDIEEEKKKAESLAADLEKFELAVKYASDHIVITDDEGIIIYANQAVSRITGFSVDEVMGQKAGSTNLWGGNMSKEFYSEFWDTIKNKKKPFSGEIKNKRKNGDEYYAYSTVTPVLGSDGEVEFFVGIERDITEDKRIDVAKSEFVSLASHQLRTPLTSIKWYAELLEDTSPLSDDQHKYINEISTATLRMVDLVNALLNVSRIELGTLAINPKPTNLIQLMRSVLDELKLLIDNKKLKISAQNESLPEIPVDPKTFRIVYQNLITNSIKYTPEGGSISISHKIKDSDIIISIMDTGYGIPNDQKDHIFKKLFRADNVQEKDTEGTGLGLYIVKSIIEESGGSIWFESKVNKGTTFYVQLPLKGMEKKEGSKPLETTTASLVT